MAVRRPISRPGIDSEEPALPFDKPVIGGSGVAQPPPPANDDVLQYGPTKNAQSGEGPRERELMGTKTGGISAAPRRPMSPTPMAGSTMQAGGVKPFNPMPGVSPTAMTSTRRSAYGGLGGLTGGGFGLPLDPTSNQASDPITTLISQMLKGKR